MSIQGKKIIEILEKISEKIDENKAYLSELDAAIGDGDHGLNMNKGFKAVVEKIKDDDGNDIGGILKKSGMALVSNVGGASGPLYGTAFMKAAVSVNGKSEVDINDFANMLDEALEGIKMRGKGQADDKTMIDAIEPALKSIKEGIDSGLEAKEILKVAKEAAYKGVEHTKEIIAKKGRASYLGERSLGHQDAGATSSAIILETIYEALN
ncbi:dihydroxyacetone kinase subunit DhaL [Clostridium beijerinckii]|uniref:phosphoenolpyruvate--glycerone phosphotransferase n=1 Tax=Clostridium beijerinckii TaxID=1520 RepID=A0A1B9BNN8_CLOBE|nr:dihydroxyacetone kinase subunit DhaL [Clostridium beijerinckii]AQS04891.1 PTS-dependent dihydroxyacetone kinase, ADP-binding subunit DhaL [Clostridium beijerinckii]MBA2888016.1 dihydroxyacetone kinase-like protein [Clostridium beijerinckii]MBA2902779.1 dihydroxyacetone kinase-like protein [Clostridium beijerinckii]MBA2912574.1 dihydroxyacetone kinase-like protein [Clostridium beijerinckii]MBA9015547.1 dihydroxyacetone kinase-like protein [Clostridium beijerinckii]